MSPHRKVRDARPEGAPSAAVGRRPRSADDEAVAYASPARDLQAALSEHLEAALPEQPQRWPGAVRLGIIGGGSALLWAGIITLGRAALNL